MSTSNVLNHVAGAISGLGAFQVQAPVADATASIAQGDLVYWDSAAKLAKPIDSDAHAATILGVAMGPSKVSSGLDSPSAPAVQAIQVEALALAALKTTASETYTHGLKVYIGADAQTITTVAGSNAVGVIQLPAGVSSVTGAAGKVINVLVFHKAFLPLGA